MKLLLMSGWVYKIRNNGPEKIKKRENRYKKNKGQKIIGCKNIKNGEYWAK